MKASSIAFALCLLPMILSCQKQETGQRAYVVPELKEVQAANRELVNKIELDDKYKQEKFKQALCEKATASIVKGRNYLLRSVRTSYENIKKAKKPTQADLYILTHFLIYQDMLKVEPNEQNAAILKKNVLEYFTSTYKNKSWMEECCLLAKFIIGFQNAGGTGKQMIPILQEYKSFIDKQWGGKGVGECFTPNIDRSFGGNMEGGLQCTEIKPSVGAKTVYFIARTSHLWKNPLESLNLSYLNNTLSGLETNTVRGIPELWLLKTYKIQKKEYVTEARAKAAMEHLKTALEKKDNEKLIPMDIIMLTAYINGLEAVDNVIVKSIPWIIGLQMENGSFPAVFGAHNQRPFHNVNAVFSDYYVETLHLFKKYYCHK